MINLRRHILGWRKAVRRSRPLLCGASLFLAMSSLACIISPPSLASAENKEQAASEENVKEGVKIFRINIQRLQEGLAAQREQFSESLNTERNLLEELEDIDKRLAEQTSKLKALEEQKDSQQVVIDQKERELADVRSEKEKVQRHLQRRIGAYYKMGNIGLLNVTFSAQTLPELLKFHDAFQSLISYDQNVIEIYRKSIDKLERVTKTLGLEKSVLMDFITQAVTEQKAIDGTKNDKETLLLHIQTQSQLHKQAIDEMEKAAAELSSSLLALKTKEEKLEQRFQDKKGLLPPPVPGILVTQFQQESPNSLGIAKKSQGIAIQAPDGSKVKAIFPGTVVFAGYLRGYGNTIIVHHGFQYYSITSRVESILTEKGFTVAAGSVLAETGETATLMEEGICFELRHGSTSLDPMIWLAPGGLQHQETLPKD